METKPNKILNGKSYRWGDLYDSWNTFQQQHFDGIIDVYTPRDGMPSLVQQWKDDARRRYGKKGKAND